MIPHPLQQPLQGIGLNAVATVINGGWSVVLIRMGRRLRSPALAADGRHLLADVVTSVGIAVGVGLAVLTGYLALDPLLAAATGVYVLWSGMPMISASVGGLMDAAPEPAVVQRIRDLVANSAAGAIEAHDLRTRHAGRLTFLEFHLVVPGAMTVAAAHEICDRIEDTLKAEMSHLVITIHVEPEEKAKQHGVLVLWILPGEDTLQEGICRCRRPPCKVPTLRQPALHPAPPAGLCTTRQTAQY